MRGRAAAIVIGIMTTAGLALAQAPAPQGPPIATGRVAYPTGYSTGFTLYEKVDRVDRKTVRFMYVSPNAAAARLAGGLLPDGAVVVMEDHPAEVDAAGNVVLDAAGRLKPLDRVLAVFVMEKRAGWGAAIPADLRNGDWDYAMFDPSGAARAIPTNGCFSCHLPQAAKDYTFTTIR